MANLTSKIVIEGQNNAAAAIAQAIAGITSLKTMVDGLSKSFDKQASAATAAATATSAAATSTATAVSKSSSTVQASTAAFAQMAASAQAAFAQVTAAAQASVAATNATTTAANAAAAAFAKMGSSAQSAASGTSKSMEGTQSVMSQLKTGLAYFIGFSAIKSLATDFIHMSDEITNANAKIKLATSSFSEFKDVQGKLFAISQQNSASLIATASIYSRMRLATQGMSIDNNQLIGVTDTLQKTFLISGASAQEAKYGMLEFSHAMSEGRLMGRQLNALLMENPALMASIARGLGVTQGKLRELTTEGALSTKLMLDAMRADKDSIDTAAKDIPLTFGRAMTQLHNSVLEWIGDVNDSNGATKTMAEAMVDLSKHIGEVATLILHGIEAVVTAIVISLMPSILALVERLTVGGAAVTYFTELLAAMEVVLVGPAGIALALAAVGFAFVSLGDDANNSGNRVAAAALKMVEAAKNARKAADLITNAKTDSEKAAAGEAGSKSVDETKSAIIEARRSKTAAEANQLGSVTGAIYKLGEFMMPMMHVGDREKKLNDQIAQADKISAEGFKTIADIKIAAKTSGVKLAESAAPTTASNHKNLSIEQYESFKKSVENKEEKQKELRDEALEKYRASKGITDKSDTSHESDADFQHVMQNIALKDAKAKAAKNTGSAADYGVDKAQIEAESKIQIDAEKRTQESLKSEYAEGLMSLKDYQQKRMESIDRALQAELRAKKAEAEAADKAVAKAKAGGNKTEIDGALARQFTLNADIKRIEGELAGERNKNNPKFIAEQNALNAELEKTRTQIQQITGTQTEANIAKQVEISLHKEWLAAKAEKTAASEAEYKQLLELKTAEAQYKALVVDKIALIKVEEAAQIAALEYRKTQGLSAVAAEQQLNAIHVETAGLLEKLIPLADKYAEKIGDKLPAEVVILKTSIASLKVETDSFATSINTNLKDAFATAFAGIMDHTKTFKQAFGDIFKSLTSTINKNVSEQLATQLTNAIGGGGDGKGGIGGLFSSLLGGKDASKLGTKNNPMMVRNADGSGAAGAGGLFGSGPTDDTGTASLAPGDVAKDGVKGVGNSLESGLNSMFSNVASIVKNPIAALGNFLQSAISSIFSGMSGGASGGGGLGSALGGIFGKFFGGSGGSAAAGSATSGIVSGAVDNVMFAEGGHVRGSGTGTSDSIQARLSDGEYVITAATVAQYGVNFFDNINNSGKRSASKSSMPGQVAFATGGLVQADRIDGKNGSGEKTVHNHSWNFPNSNPDSFRQSQGQMQVQVSRAIDRSRRDR